MSTEPAPAPFIVANPGSGTTLLRMMLDAHPDLAIPPETHFLPELIATAREIRRANDRKPTGEELADAIASRRRWEDFHLDRDELVERMSGRRGESGSKAAIRAFYELYAESQGKPRWGDKTPDYLLYIRRIGRVLPEARFIHLIRDGRDVAASRRRWRGRAGGKDRPVEAWAAQWRRWIETARRQSRDVESYLEVRYEDLVTDTEPVLRRVCEQIELDFRPEMLDYHERAGERLAELDRSLPAAEGKGAREAGHRQAKHALTAAPPQESKIQAWRKEMSDAERVAFEAEAGELLEELGYPVGEPLTDPGAPGREAEEATGQ
jgi:hypothetical protein